MPIVKQIDVASSVLDISKDLSVVTRARKPGPPERIDGMTVGVVTSQPGQSPHNGEMHPDGDEILIVISGALRVTCDGQEPIELTVGEACVVEKGAWHQVDCSTPSTFVHITPGPNGDARF